ncbi:hypothetical protein TR2A62_1419 [Thalassobium sp. R2A62]|nr:hypothetical protein TR2A62_1419 [Thalassobium sp. R2A62]
MFKGVYTSRTRSGAMGSRIFSPQMTQVSPVTRNRMRGTSGT